MIYNTLWNFVWKLMLISTSEFTLANIFPNWPDFFFYSSLQANRNVHLMDMNALLTVINMMRVYYFFYLKCLLKYLQNMTMHFKWCRIMFDLILHDYSTIMAFYLFLLHFTIFFFTCKWKYITSLCRFDDDI